MPKNPTKLSGASVGMAMVLLRVAVLASPSVAHASQAQSQALVNQYCAVCHNQKLKSGGISLAGLNLSDIDGNSSTLEKVLRKVHSGEMPPLSMPRPDASTARAFTQWLQDELDRGAAAHPNPGRPTIHRLNRTEYSNAVRDLLALDIKPGAMLPPDDTGYGFDNIGEVLSLAPVLIERYMSVARTVSRLAVGDEAVKPESVEFRPPKNSRRRERSSDDLPFDSAGGLSVSYRFPLDAEYVVRIKLAPAAGFDGPQETNSLELRLPVKAGTRNVGVTFPRQEAFPELIAGGLRGAAPVKVTQQPPTPSPALFADLRLDGARLKSYDLPEGAAAAVVSMTISGPYNIAGPGDTPSRDKIFICRPAAAKDEEPCAEKIISALAHRAFRRPISGSDVKPLLAFYERGRREGTFENGVEMALRAMLVSPDFLFRIERDPAGLASGSVYRVNDYELASRLSFFLWSSIPDDELLDVAAHGSLHDHAVLERQVRRMLADPRADSLVSNFADQWLYLRNLRGVAPDLEAFPNFDDNLRQAFKRETELFFASIIQEDRSVIDLLDANYTFVNERLAKHYGIPNVFGSQFRRVSWPDDSPRRGLLGQGSILTVTSIATRTSPVQRGKWQETRLVVQVVPDHPDPAEPRVRSDRPLLGGKSPQEGLEHGAARLARGIAPAVHGYGVHAIAPRERCRPSLLEGKCSA